MPPWVTWSTWSHGWYPPETADDWDAVGLAAGDPDAEVRRDRCWRSTRRCRAAREAADWDADLLLTHHPLFLRGVHGVAETTPKGRTLATLTRAGCALLTAHTNADHAARGVSDALARALGLRDVRAGRAAAAEPLDKLVVFAPVGDADADPRGARRGGRRAGSATTTAARSSSPARAGSGRSRARTRRSAGSASSRSARRGADRGGAAAGTPRGRRRARCWRPTPTRRSAYDVDRAGRRRAPRAPAPGRVGDGRRDHARGVRRRTSPDALPPTARGVLVGGDPDRVVRRVAVLRRGRRLPARPRRWRSGADVYVTSDLRHHAGGGVPREGRARRCST